MVSPVNRRSPVPRAQRLPVQLAPTSPWRLFDSSMSSVPLSSSWSPNGVFMVKFSMLTDLFITSLPVAFLIVYCSWK